ncbi:MAG: membrane protein insertase YidC [Gammaproteobacteria bacterium]|nr:membrane protein insertase YidC [Gammaproteobacteria bacterium]
MDNTRLILFIVLSFISYMIWDAWQKDYGPKPAPTPTTAAAPTTAKSEKNDLPSVNASPVPATTPADSAQHAESRNAVHVRTDLLALEINLRGAVIDRAALLAYPIDPKTPDVPFQLMAADSTRFFIAQGGLKAEGESPDHHAAFTSAATEYKLDANTPELVVPLTWTSPAGVAVTKEFVFKRGSYEVNIRYRVKNASAEAWRANEYEQLQRMPDPGQSRIVKTFTGAALSTPEKSYKKFEFSALQKEPLKVQAKGGWIAVQEHYFVSALIPPATDANHYYSSAIDSTHFAVGYYGPAFTVAPGAEQVVETRLYAGPKLQDSLGQIAPGLELTIDYGILWFIAKLLFWGLTHIHGIIGNWGWAIILLTVFVKGMFYPLSAAGYRSMAKMRRVQPRLLAIRERYGDDRARLNQAMMDLYKEEKINPLGGCLPILIQVPVFISLYWVLLESVELRQANFMFWIHDLSTKDPLFVLPLIMGVSMFFQQKMNPAPVDPVQAKVMQVLPFAFTVFFAFFPSGLVLYWVVNNVLSIAQQWYITRSIEQAHGAHAH